MGDLEDHGEKFANGERRSGHWAHVRDEFLKGKTCASCGGTESLEAHHIVPFHVCLDIGRGYAELDTRNLIALCRGPRNCHLLIGHLDDFASFNLGVKADAKGLADLQDQDAVKKSPEWEHRHLHRPRHWGHLTTAYEKAAILRYVDTHYPIGKAEPAEVA